MVEKQLQVWVMTPLGDDFNSSINELLRPFLAENPGLTIDWRGIPWNSMPWELIKAFKMGSGPDIFQSGMSMLGTINHLDFPAEVPTWVETRPVIAPVLDEIVQYNGRRVAVPWFLDSTFLNARADFVQAMKIDSKKISTWEGFLETCREINRLRDNDPNLPYPFGITCHPIAITLHNALSWLFSGGWQYPCFSNSPVEFFNSPKAIPGFQYLSELLQISHCPDYINKIQSFRFYYDFYEAGHFIFAVGDCRPFIQQLTGYCPEYVSFPLELYPIPKGPYGAIPWAGGSCLSVSNQSRNIEKAWELVRFIISDDFMRTWVHKTGYQPAHEGSFWNDYAGSPYLQLIKDSFQVAFPLPKHPLWNSLHIYIVTCISEVLWDFINGKKFDEKIQARLLALDTQINRLLRLAWEVEND